MDVEDVFIFQCYTMAIVLGCNYISSRKRAPRRWWVRPINRRRDEQGDYNNLLQEMRLGDTEQFFLYTRMNVESFDYLLSLVGPTLRKRSIRKSLPPGIRGITWHYHLAALTLRYLATGDDLQTISWSYRIGKSTCCNAIRKTARAIGNILSDVYLREPTQHGYLSIADHFYERWNMPNCVGAIDGKHVNIQAPNNSGSEYFCYKSHFSIVFLAVCDADYLFTHVDIGAYGSQSDGGIFMQSVFGQNFNNGTLPLPKPDVLPLTLSEVPFYFVGDGALALHKNMMRPYPGVGLTTTKKIFNYRLSRARRIIENTFGILVARWRIFHRVINASADNVDSLIKATVCLHNYLKIREYNAVNKLYCPPSFIDRENNGDLVDGEWRREVPENVGAIQPLNTIRRRLGARNATFNATQIRETIAEYLSSPEGSVPWQLSKVNRGVMPGLLE